MDSSATVRASCKDSRTRGLGYLLGGLALLILSASINIRHTVAHSADQIDTLLSAGLALAMTVGFVVLPSFASQRVRTRGFIAAVWCAVLICGGISLTNIVGASMGQRLATSADATDATRKRQEAAALIAKNEAMLASIGAVPAAEIIQADIDAKLTSRRDLDGCEAKWLPSSGARAVCIEVHRLRAEKAKADRAATLEAEIVAARSMINGTAASKIVGSGDTAAIVTAAQRFGWKLDGETVDLVKSVGLAMGVELFAALLFVSWQRAKQEPISALADAIVPSTKVAPLAGAPVETALSPDVLPRYPAVPLLGRPESGLGCPLAGGFVVDGVPARPECDATAEAAVLAALRARGGAVVASQRDMATLFGLSRSAVNRELHKLASDGKVRLVTTSRGTAVTLAA